MGNSEQEIQLKIKEISQKIKSLRKQKGYTSYETFAFDNNINRVQYWRVESGQNITLKTLINILDIHKITLAEFFSDL